MLVEIFCTCDSCFMGGTDYHCQIRHSGIMETARRMKKRSEKASYENVKIWICNPTQWTQKVCEMGLKDFNKWAESNCERIL